jgi:hypothetical protein
MKLALAFLCAATAFPAMLFERLAPIGPEPHLIAGEPDRTFYHNSKNIWTETLRADEQWWGKLLAFVICVLGVAAIF